MCHVPRLAGRQVRREKGECCEARSVRKNVNAETTGGKLPLAIVVLGASGDLACRKIIPALFALYCQSRLPANFAIFGFARTSLTHESFRAHLTAHLTCRYSPDASCADRMDEFLGRCYYCPGQYGRADAYLDLYELMRRVVGSSAHRLFYMAVPPDVVMEVSRALASAGLVECGGRELWSRVVVEKPFGRDRMTSDRMVREMHDVFTEDCTYRIDHYLGKEVVQNLMVLRFANSIFEPLWNRRHISSIHITWREPMGVGLRGGYFDGYGIIRDVMQNHLMQILSLLLMEQPSSVAPDAINLEKVRLLRSVAPLGLGDVSVGQYTADATGKHAGYLAERGVSPSSMTPTFAAVAMRIQNPRWEGVPVFVEAGKAMDRHINEVRIRFRGMPSGLWTGSMGRVEPNELIIRVQPDEAIELSVMSKVPGLELSIRPTSLNLRYHEAFTTLIPDAYECLLLDVMGGDRSLFIRAEELAAAWDIFTPALHHLEKRGVKPQSYLFGSGGPASAAELAGKVGVLRRGGE